MQVITISEGWYCRLAILLDAAAQGCTPDTSSHVAGYIIVELLTQVDLLEGPELPSNA